MKVIELLKRYESQRKVSFEVLPPLKGNGTTTLFASLDKLMEFDPLYINITTHHSEYVYIPLADGKVSLSLVNHDALQRLPKTALVLIPT